MSLLSFAEDVWDVVKSVVVTGAAAAVNPACGAGVTAFAGSEARMAFADTDPPRSLTPEEIAICAQILTLGGHVSVKLNKVSLYTGASLGWLPGSKDGLTLNYDVYLKTTDFSVCNWRHMKLLIHELVHVDQYETLGALEFACVYGTLIAADFDSNNELEIEADRVEEGFLPQLQEACRAACAARPGSGIPETDATPSDWFWVVWS